MALIFCIAGDDHVLVIALDMGADVNSTGILCDPA